MDRIQLRRDSSARWAEINPILLEGEVGYEIDTKFRKIGDGVHRWNDLEYLKAENIVQETGNSENATMSQYAVTRELSELSSEVGQLFKAQRIEEGNQNITTFVKKGKNYLLLTEPTSGTAQISCLVNEVWNVVLDTKADGYLKEFEIPQNTTKVFIQGSYIGEFVITQGLNLMNITVPNIKEILGHYVLIDRTNSDNTLFNAERNVPYKLSFDTLSGNYFRVNWFDEGWRYEGEDGYITTTSFQEIDVCIPVNARNVMIQGTYIGKIELKSGVAGESGHNTRLIHNQNYKYNKLEATGKAHVELTGDRYLRGGQIYNYLLPEHTRDEKGNVLYNTNFYIKKDLYIKAGDTIVFGDQCHLIFDGGSIIGEGNVRFYKNVLCGNNIKITCGISKGSTLLNDKINVKWFGAAPVAEYNFDTSTHDDSVAFNKAMSIARNDIPGIGAFQTVYVPKGIYKLFYPLDSDGALRIEGEGSYSSRIVAAFDKPRALIRRVSSYNTIMKGISIGSVSNSTIFSGGASGEFFPENKENISNVTLIQDLLAPKKRTSSNLE